MAAEGEHQRKKAPSQSGKALSGSIYRLTSRDGSGDRRAEFIAVYTTQSAFGRSKFLSIDLRYLRVGGSGICFGAEKT